MVQANRNLLINEIPLIKSLCKKAFFTTLMFPSEGCNSKQPTTVAGLKVYEEYAGSS